MDTEETPYRDNALYVGIVVSNDDPLKRGFVDVKVPGLLEPSAKAQCVMPGTPFNNGIFVVPAVGSTVIVGFLNGEYDSPIVLGGFAPTVVEGGMRSQMSSADVPGVMTIETAGFVIVIGKKDTPAPYLSIVNREDQDFSLILDLARKIAELVMPTGIAVRTKGLLDLRGRLAQINQRPIQENSEPI